MTTTDVTRTKIQTRQEINAEVDRAAGHGSLNRLVGRIRGLLEDVRKEESVAWPKWLESTERHEWAALHRCGNKLEEALGSLVTIAPNEKLTDLRQPQRTNE